jgi:hypothetical protein
VSEAVAADDANCATLECEEATSADDTRSVGAVTGDQETAADICAALSSSLKPERLLLRVKHAAQYR